MAIRKAALITDRAPTVLFTQRRFEPDAQQHELLAACGVTIERQLGVASVGTVLRWRAFSWPTAAWRAVLPGSSAVPSTTGCSNL
jgi:hypothetical protein